MASDEPVLPPVNSTTRMPGLRAPRASAPSIIASAMRSLYRPRRIEILQLDDDRRRVGRHDPAEAHEWRAADRVEDRINESWGRHAGHSSSYTAIYQTARKRLASIDSDAVQRETVRGVRAVAGERLPVLVPAQTKLYTEQCLGR